MEEAKKLETVHVLLTTPADEYETHCNIFRSKKAVFEYIINRIKADVEDEYGSEETKQKKISFYAAEMEKSMNERGYWNGVDFYTYVYEEKHFEEDEQ